MLAADVPDLFEDIGHLSVAKGRKVVRIDFEVDRPTDEELVALVCSRFGKLRAPTMRSGDRMFVGYNAEMLTALLPSKG